MAVEQRHVGEAPVSVKDDAQAHFQFDSDSFGLLLPGFDGRALCAGLRHTTRSPAFSLGEFADFFDAMITGETMTKPVAGSGIAARPFDPVEVLLEVAEQFGIPKIARELGKSQQLLRRKLNETDDYSTPSLREAVAITRVAGDRSLLEWWCRAEGGLYFDLPPMGGGDDDVLDELIQVTESLGKFARDLRQSRADGVITPDEFVRQQRDAMRVHQCLERLMATLAAQIRDMPRQLGICAGDEQPRSP